VQAFTLAADCQFTTRWQHRFDPANAGSPPTIAGGVVYVGSARSGWLRAYRLRDAQALFGAHVSTQAIFAAPSVDRGVVLVASWGGQLVALKPRG
jgi:outer membrane protein assembly factor BamB